jgi:hypothetical protein
LVSCSGENKKVPTNKKVQRESQTDSIKKVKDFHLPDNHFVRMKGTIGRYPVTLVFIKMDSLLSGTYYYDKITKPIVLDGKWNSNKATAELSAYSSSHETNGTFKGQFQSEDSFTGLWTSATTKKTLPFSLQAVAHEITSVSRKIHYRKNCDQIDKHKDKPKQELHYADTLCSEITLKDLVIQCKSPFITSAIRKEIDLKLCATYGERKKSVKELLDMVDLENTYNEDPFGFYLEVECSVFSILKKIVSLQVQNNSYCYGAAHPNSGRSCLNVNLETGGRLKLEDVFLPGTSSTLSELAERCFLSENGAEGWDFIPGRFKVAANFNVTVDGLHFFYNPYEIGSYAAGSPHFFLPYSQLKGLLTADFLSLVKE